MDTPKLDTQMWHWAQDQGVRIVTALTDDNDDRATVILSELCATQDTEHLFVLACTLIAGSGFSPAARPLVLTMGTLGRGALLSSDIDHAPPFVRALAQFPVLVASKDLDTAWALWIAMDEEDRARLLALISGMAAELLVRKFMEEEATVAEEPSAHEDTYPSWWHQITHRHKQLTKEGVVRIFLCSRRRDRFVMEVLIKVDGDERAYRVAGRTFTPPVARGLMTAATPTEVYQWLAATPHVVGRME